MIFKSSLLHFEIIVDCLITGHIYFTWLCMWSEIQRSISYQWYEALFTLLCSLWLHVESFFLPLLLLFLKKGGGVRKKVWYRSLDFRSRVSLCEVYVSCDKTIHSNFQSKWRRKGQEDLNITMIVTMEKPMTYILHSHDSCIYLMPWFLY